jgi:cysteinyl-tRNA synthetase
MRRLVFSVVLAGSWLAAVSCVTDGEDPRIPDACYRDSMRDFVMDISAWAKSVSPGFLVVTQNGQELFTEDGEPDGDPEAVYLAAMDGTGREDLFFGYEADDEPTPVAETQWMAAFLDLAESRDIEAIVIDYCWTHWRMDSSYAWNGAAGYVSFAADRRELDDIPDYPSEPFRTNDDAVLSLGDAGNLLYLINPEGYSSRQAFVSAVSATNYDLIVLDLFWNGEPLTPADLEALSTKPCGAGRLVLAYVSIGEAEDYRYYWQEEWASSPPSWLHEENPDWPGNYLVDYSDPAWQAIIYGSDGSYVGMVIQAGFDGVYLDKVDSFETWE